jgi:hypothetical protein
VSTRASIYYFDEGVSRYVHVAEELLDEEIVIEVDSLDNDGTVRLSYEQAVEMATKILSYANWPDKINRREMAKR